MLNLPHEDIIIGLGDKANMYNYVIAATSLMKEPSTYFPYPLNIGYIHPKSQMINYVMNHILFPKKANFSLLTRVDVKTIWMIEKSQDKLGTTSN